MQREKSRVVLDTNVVVSAAVSQDGKPAQIFEMLLKGDIINYTTTEIIEEIAIVLKRPALNIRPEYQRFILNNFCSCSIAINPNFNEKASTDEKDNKFINCALAAKADIISGDKHLLGLGEYKGIKIVKVADFLKTIEG